MTAIGFFDRLGRVFTGIERMIFNQTIRRVSHVIERISGFNNHDQVIAIHLAILIWTMYLFSVYSTGMSHIDIHAQVDAHSEMINVAITYCVIMGAIFVFMFTKHIQAVMIFRKQMFFDGKLPQIILGSVNNDRFFLALLTALSCFVFFKSQNIEIRRAMLYVPLLYIAIGLAKMEPYFRNTEQDKRCKPLMCCAFLLLVCNLLIFALICHRYIAGIHVFAVLLLFALKLAILSKIGSLHAYNRSLIYRSVFSKTEEDDT